MHQPVLLHEVIEFLNPKSGEFVIDGTIGGGGHAVAILGKIMPKGKFLGLDWDSAALARAKERIAAVPGYQSLISKQIFLIHGSYADLLEILKNGKLGKADGLLLDLGFSSEQLENSGRGFSFNPPAGGEPLFMTYDTNRKPVRDILNEIETKELAKIIFELSGEKFAMRIARAIKAEEKVKAIETTGELREIVRGAVPTNYECGRIDPATRTFQALRIYANDELGNLKKILDNLERILKPGGRVAAISFHSLEDGIVKNSFRKKERMGQLRILTKKPVVPGEEEISKNPRSRSAKLRAAELI
jgi:16S rRNA (cytosine1402-N4)-methyltransferase